MIRPLLILLLLSLMLPKAVSSAPRGLVADPPAPLPMAALASFDFDAQPLGPAGLGGAALGQPHSLSSAAVLAEVVDHAGSRALQVSALASATPASEAVRFQWLENANLTDELIRLRLTLTLTALDNYVIRITRARSVADQILTLAFRASGQIRVEGAPATVVVGSYTAGATRDIVIDINRADGSWSLALDGESVLTHRPSSVATTGAGVGRLSLGWISPVMGATATLGQPFIVDRIEVSTPEPLTPLLLADFAGLTPGAAIGTGGALLGEPAAIGAQLATEILDAGGGERALRLRRASTGLDALVDWRLIDGVTVPGGHVLADQWLTLRDATELLYRLTDASSAELIRVTSSSTGQLFVRFPDDSFSGTAIGSYTINMPLRLRVSCDLDARHCSVALGSRWLLTARPLPADLPEPLSFASLRSGFTLLTSVGHRVDIERIALYSNGPTGTPAAIEYLQQPVDVPRFEAMDPPLRLRVSDPSGAPVADGTPVMIEVAEGGPFTALLSEDRAFSVDGEVSFAAQFGERGTAYRLLAYVEDPPYASIEVLSAPFAVGPGLPATMSWLQQPSPALVGASIEPEVAVQLRDLLGDPVGPGHEARLVVASGPGGASIGGNVVSTNASGIASFPDLEAYVPGSYMLGVEVDSPGFASTPSSSFTVFANVPASASFQVQPSNGPAAEPISPAVEVRVLNPLGSAVPDGTSVELQRASGPASAALSGNTATTVAGVARFPELRVAEPGSYTLRAVVAGLDSALQPISSSFQRLPGPPASLVVTAYPVQPAALLPILALDVQVSDAAGFAVGGVLVRAEIASGPAGAELLGPATATSAAAGGALGRARFAGRLRFSLPGSYTLRFRVDEGPQVISETIEVLPGGAASASILVQPPASVFAELPIQPAVEFELRNAEAGPVMDGILVGLVLLDPVEPVDVEPVAFAFTEGGRARFDGLAIAQPGTYALRLSVEGIDEDDAPITDSFIVLPNRIFQTGFEAAD